MISCEEGLFLLQPEAKMINGMSGGVKSSKGSPLCPDDVAILQKLHVGSTHAQGQSRICGIFSRAQATKRETLTGRTTSPKKEVRKRL